MKLNIALIFFTLIFLSSYSAAGIGSVRDTLKTNAEKVRQAGEQAERFKVSANNFKELSAQLKKKAEADYNSWGFGFGTFSRKPTGKTTSEREIPNETSTAAMEESDPAPTAVSFWNKLAPRKNNTVPKKEEPKDSTQETVASSSEMFNDSKKSPTAGGYWDFLPKF